MTLAAQYLTVGGIVLLTVADGSCGLDVMCLMLGLQRDAQERLSLRYELAAFVMKQIGNRALVAMVHG